MLRIKIPHDVVGTSGYHCGVLRSFLVEKIEQGIRPKSMERASVLHQPNGVGSNRYRVVPCGELDGIPVALVARSACESVRADAVMKCCDDVTKWVVTESCRVGGAVSNRCEHKSLRILVLVRRVIPTTSVSRPQLKSNRLEDRVMHNNSEGKKQKVEEHHRNFKFSNNKMSVTACNDSLNAKTLNVNFVCVTCGKCVLNDNHNMCVFHYINGENSRTKMPMAVPISTREPKQTVNQSAATPLKRTVAAESTNQKPRSTIRKQYEQISKTCRWCYYKITPPGYKWKPKSRTVNIETNVSMHLGTKSRTTNISEPTTLRKSTVSDTSSSSNSFAAPILGYGDLVQGKVTIKRVYYVEGLNHSLLFVGQFCDADLEVSFWKSTCYIRDLKGNDLLTDHVSSDPVPQCLTTALEHANLSPGPQSQENVPQAVETVTTLNELDFLFSLMFDELLNGTTQVVSKSSAVTTADAPSQRQQQHITPSTLTTVSIDTPPLNIQITPETTSQAQTQAPTVTANENIIQAETNKEHAQVNEDEFINIFSTPVQERVETSSRYVDSHNMHTFYQRHPS
ncbi:hypothetical protein Tco_0934715 [Tanacetum coccineum]